MPFFSRFAETCGRFWKTSTFASSSQWRALRTYLIRNYCYCLGVFGGCYDDNPQPAVYKKNLSGHRVQSKKNRLDLQVTLKIDLKVMMVKVMYTLTFHRLSWSILNVCLPWKTKTIQKKGIWSFLRNFTLIVYLSKVTKTIFPQVTLTWNFPFFSNPQSRIGVSIQEKGLEKLTSR